MTDVRQLAAEFIQEYLNREPEFIDVAEFIDENYDTSDHDYSDDGLYRAVHDQVTIMLMEMRVPFYGSENE